MPDIFLNLDPSPENIRAEMARYRITRPELCDRIGMHHNTFSNYVGGHRRMPKWAEHNICYTINEITGRRVFNIDMTKELMPAPPSRPITSPTLSKAVSKARSHRASVVGRYRKTWRPALADLKFVLR